MAASPNSLHLENACEGRKNRSGFIHPELPKLQCGCVRLIWKDVKDKPLYGKSGRWVGEQVQAFCWRTYTELRVLVSAGGGP